MKRLAALVFPGFELLDLFGPLELFGFLDREIEITIVSEHGGPVASAQGPRVMTDQTLDQGSDYDLILVPGGRGTRAEVRNQPLLRWIGNAGKEAEIVMSVCTGAALLASAGLLDGRRATTNKIAFKWVARTAKQTDWIACARWVEDGKFWTSSGVSAGMDMALAVIERLQGPEEADQAAIYAEYDWHKDPDRDPFAAVHGLV